VDKVVFCVDSWIVFFFVELEDCELGCVVEKRKFMYGWEACLCRTCWTRFDGDGEFDIEITLERELSFISRFRGKCGKRGHRKKGKKI
jgi:hypothetical protein